MLLDVEAVGDAADSPQTKSYVRMRVVSSILGVGTLIVVCAVYFKSKSEVAQAAQFVPMTHVSSRRRRGKAGHGSGLSLLGLALVELDNAIEVKCSSSEYCNSRASGTFCYVDVCAPCVQCQHCWDGVDGTCGQCGMGYPTRAQKDVNCSSGEETPRSTDVATCAEHSDCVKSAKLFCYDGQCTSCKECQYCRDGVDGTCGTCGNGHLMEEHSCEA